MHLGWNDVPFMDCKVQCYDVASNNMVGGRTWEATRDCVTCPFDTVSRSRSSAVGDNIKVIKIMRGTLDSAFALNKLVKYSMVYNIRKKNQVLSKNKKSFQQVEETHSTRKLWWHNIIPKSLACYRGIVAKHFESLGCLLRVLGWNFIGKCNNSEVQGQVIGVQTQMQSFHLYFGIQTGILVLMHRNNLSFTLQCTHVMFYSMIQIHLML